MALVKVYLLLVLMLSQKKELVCNVALIKVYLLGLALGRWFGCLALSLPASVFVCLCLTLSLSVSEFVSRSFSVSDFVSLSLCLHLSFFVF